MLKLDARVFGAILPAGVPDSILTDDWEFLAEFTNVLRVVNSSPVSKYCNANISATLLHMAVGNKATLVLKTLLDYPGCAIDARCPLGKTALDWALESNAKECVVLLRDHSKRLAINAARPEAEAKAKAEEQAHLSAEQAKAEAKAKADEHARFAAEIKAEVLGQIAAVTAQLQTMQQQQETFIAQSQATQQQATFSAQSQAIQQQQETLIQRLQNQMPWLRLDDEARASSSNEGTRCVVASDIQSFYQDQDQDQDQDQVPVPENHTAIFPAHVVPEHINIPELFRCPITKLIMVDPVLTKAHQTYERETIKAWLDKKDNDPNTGSNLNDKTLSDNVFARQAIDAFIQQHSVLKSSDEIYLPQSLLKNLRDALVKQDSYKVRDLIQHDKRLLARYLAPGRTAFHAACEVGTKEILEYILNNLSTEELNTLLALPRPDAWQPVVLNESLLTAATQGDIKEMESVLRLGADIETRDAEWKTPLCRAAQANQLDAVDLLLTKGANISARDAQHNAPLDLAILQGFNPIIMRLLDQGLPSYQPTSPADPKQFGYMSLKFIYEITRGQKIGNRAISAASSSSSSSTKPTPTTTVANSTGSAHRSGFFAPPSSPAAANDLSSAVEPVNMDSTDDLKKANKP